MRLLAGVLTVVLGSGLAMTAPPASAAPSAPPPLQKASDVPDDEKLTHSSQALAALREMIQRVQGLQEEARRARDVVKRSCIHEKLTQLKGLLRIAAQTDRTLQSAVIRRETTVSEFGYTKVMLARQKASQLRTEAEQCIGQLAFRTDESLSIEVEEPRDLPGKDPTLPDLPGGIIIRPPPASPIL